MSERGQYARFSGTESRPLVGDAPPAYSTIPVNSTASPPLVATEYVTVSHQPKPYAYRHVAGESAQQRVAREILGFYVGTLITRSMILCFLCAIFGTPLTLLCFIPAIKMANNVTVYADKGQCEKAYSAYQCARILVALGVGFGLLLSVGVTVGGLLLWQQS